MFASRTHGYDTTDHYRLDPRLGDDADFDRLIDARPRAAVCGYCSTGFSTTSGTDFPRYRRAVDNGDAEAAGWFGGRPGRFHTFEGHGELIALNHATPQSPTTPST